MPVILILIWNHFSSCVILILIWNHFKSDLSQHWIFVILAWRPVHFPLTLHALSKDCPRQLPINIQCFKSALDNIKQTLRGMSVNSHKFKKASSNFCSFGDIANGESELIYMRYTSGRWINYEWEVLGVFLQLQPAYNQPLIQWTRHRSCSINTTGFHVLYCRTLHHALPWMGQTVIAVRWTPENYRCEEI